MKERETEYHYGPMIRTPDKNCHTDTNNGLNAYKINCDNPFSLLILLQPLH